MIVSTTILRLYLENMGKMYFTLHKVHHLHDDVWMMYSNYVESPMCAGE